MIMVEVLPRPSLAANSQSVPPVLFVHFFFGMSGKPLPPLFFWFLYLSLLLLFREWLILMLRFSCQLMLDGWKMNASFSLRKIDLVWSFQDDSDDGKHVICYILFFFCITRPPQGALQKWTCSPSFTRGLGSMPTIPSFPIPVTWISSPWRQCDEWREYVHWPLQVSFRISFWTSLNIGNLSDVFFLTNCRFTYCRHCQTPGCGWWPSSPFVRLSWAWTSAAGLLRPTLLACGVRWLTGFWHSRSGTNWRGSTSSPASLNLCPRRRWGSLKVSIIKP